MIGTENGGRSLAVAYHGLKCVVCGFEFEKKYGARGKDYIEVHHLRPVSTLRKPTKVNPKNDMVVVCSNCHRMIHRKGSPSSFAEFKRIYKERSTSG